MSLNNILLIDDDIDDQEIFRSALAEVNNELTVDSYGNARDALKKLEHGELAPDLIFLDLNMPIMTGQEFLEEIKKRNALRNIPVIIFSTSSDPTTMKQTKELGAIDFITKPDRFDSLLAILKPIVK